MALPKEPRQKMINLMYLVLTALLALNVSSEILNAFKVVDTSLQTSSKNLNIANETLYKSLTAKLNDPNVDKVKAQFWNDNAAKAKKLSDELNAYIDGLKKSLKEAAGLQLLDGVESFKEDNLEAATRLFDTEGKGKELEKKLIDYRKAMLDIDSSIKVRFEKTLPIDIDPPIGQDGTKKDFTQAYFHMTPTVAGLTLLSKFQNNVKNAENQVVTHCHEQIGAVKVVFDQASVLVGQSSNYVMPGQEITITAGVGAYSSNAQPRISIGGASQSVVDGKATYKLTANGAGSHTVEVNVNYLDQQGKPQSKTEKVEYTVGTPGGAAIMLDKMNVFYIGVPNPITISSGSGWDKTTVSMTGGTLTGSNSNRVVTVSTPGAATINVTADGKSSKFDFRVKSIPDPIGMVGPSKGGRIASNIFKAQGFLRAELQNFDFDARFNVVSSTVYFAGAGFTTGGGVQTGLLTSGSLDAIRAKMDLCKPGSSITFDDLKVVGPDGRTRTIPPISFVLF